MSHAAIRKSASESTTARELRLARVAATLLRLTLGVAMLAHGLLKVLVYTMPGTVAFFEAQGYPGALAWLVTAGELAAGLGLVFGVLVRAASLGLVPILAGVVATLAPNGWQFDAANGGGWEFPAILLAAAVTQALLGPGYLALGPALSRGRLRPGT